MSSHVVPLRVYFAIFVALIFGTIITVAAAYEDFGALNLPIALAIAVTKASLVVLYFMHVRYSDRVTWVVVASGFAWLALLIGGLFQDYLTRGWLGR
jgi:cytochrome c oxidase subunit IV